MNKIKKTLAAFAMIWVLMACDLDKLDNPNAVSPANSDVDFVLNQVQLSFAGLFFGMSDYGMQMTRLAHFYGPTYEAGFSAASFDGFWSTGYSGVLINTKTLIPAARDKGLYIHAGIASVIEAYTLIKLVDYFGDVPFSEALDANNFNPVADDDVTIYAAAITKLDEAIADFGQTSLAGPKNDLYYAGEKAKWATLAKTLKLRAYIQTRLVDTGAKKTAIEALVAANDLVDTAAEDFNFKYSNTIANPDSRHPYFTGDYLAGSGYYKSNYLMHEMYYGKSVVDPRIRYYFYRQVNATTTDVNELSCIVVEPPSHYLPEWPFCAVGDGYWGRDFADFSGTPPDTYKRTAFGIYPAGGRFDGNFYAPVAATQGLQGAGILPIYNSANTKFMLAEAALTMGANVGNAKTLLLDGIQRSVDKAKNFATVTPTNLIPSTTAVNNYKAFVSAQYDAAATDSDKLEVIVKEYWISLFGNGIDAFNTYRRTGKPGNLQAGLISNMGKAYRSFTYPSVYVTRNSNATQKTDNTVQVFWDTNPANFID